MGILKLHKSNEIYYNNTDYSKMPSINNNILHPFFTNISISDIQSVNLQCINIDRIYNKTYVINTVQLSTNIFSGNENAFVLEQETNVIKQGVYQYRITTATEEYLTDPFYVFGIPGSVIIPENALIGNQDEVLIGNGNIILIGNE